MRDVQSERDYRRIEINKVGVKNLRYPIVLSDKAHKRQHTVATTFLRLGMSQIPRSLCAETSRVGADSHPR